MFSFECPSQQGCGPVKVKWSYGSQFYVQCRGCGFSKYYPDIIQTAKAVQCDHETLLENVEVCVDILITP